MSTHDRAAFEAWYADEHGNPLGAQDEYGYENTHADTCWLAWQGAIAHERERMREAIRQHNDQLQAICDAQRREGRCEAYISRGLACVDCPRQWAVDRVRAPEWTRA